MDAEELKGKVLLNLRSLTQSCKGGVPLNHIERDYKDLVGDKIPFKELGFNSLEAFIRNIPDVISLRKSHDGRLMAEGVADASTAHIVSLVSRQRQTRPSARGSRKSSFARRRGGYSSRHNYRGSRSSYGNSSGPPFQTSGRAFKHDKVSSAYHSKNSTINDSTPVSHSLHKANSSVSGTARKYEVAPRFLKQQQKQVESGNSTSSSRVSPSLQFSPVKISLSNDISSSVRTVSTDLELQENDDIYNGNHVQRNPRPLLSRSNLGKLDKFKQQLETAETAKQYVEIYAKAKNLQISYKTSLMGQRKKGYVSNLHLGEKVYRSYPEVARSEAEAEEIAAKAAMERIQESKGNVERHVAVLSDNNLVIRIKC